MIVCVVVAVGVEATVEVLAGVFEDLAVAGVALGVGGDGEGVEPGQAAFEQGEHVGGV